MDIGRAIREVAKLKGMTQADLCRATGLSDAHITQLWNSKIYDPKASVLHKISVGLGVGASDIFELACKYPHPKDRKPLSDTEH